MQLWTAKENNKGKERRNKGYKRKEKNSKGKRKVNKIQHPPLTEFTN